MDERDSASAGWERVFRVRAVADEFAEWSEAELERLVERESDVELYREARELVLAKLRAAGGP